MTKENHSSPREAINARRTRVVSIRRRSEKRNPYLSDDAPLPEETESDPRDLYSAPIEEAEYVVAYIRDRRKKAFDKESFLIEMEVIEGPNAGRRILFPVPCLPERTRPRPGFSYVRLFVTCTGRRPPKDLWRRRPFNFMSGCIFRARIRDVIKGPRGEEQPVELHCSRVEKIIERIEGTPPCLVVNKS